MKESEQEQEQERNFDIKETTAYRSVLIVINLMIMDKIILQEFENEILNCIMS